ncbi:HlyD family secretion protein [Segnochrobactrum spirostomi]|uniref:HlyD family secretion protein n=1 Tax=Segnochrobactrum spirostomi TaxID=2608987 RepID=UPI0028B10379|nr:HlyD family secretion protein [Segnochrobactrum spirostomi]
MASGEASEAEISARAEQPGPQTPPAATPAPAATAPKPAAAEIGTRADVDEKRRLGRRRVLRRILMFGGVAAVVLGAGYFWLVGGRYVSVDDAYVHARKLLVATDVSGIVQEVAVKEGQHVKAGDVLFRLDPNPFQIAVDGAKAKLEQAAVQVDALKADYFRMQRDIEVGQAQVQLDQAQYDRLNALVKTDTVSRSSYDEARFTLAADQHKLASLQQVAKVQLARLRGDPNLPVEQHPEYQQALAALREDQRELDHAVVKAPFDGIVTQVDTLQPGQYLPADNPGFALVSNREVWVDANAKETDLTNVKPGDKVDVSVDTYPGLTFVGRVASISPASGSEFSVLPAQNASGNWVKVVQRIPVRIAVVQEADSPQLRAGMSVVADIDTGRERHLSDLWSGFFGGTAEAKSPAARTDGSVALAPAADTAKPVGQ